MTEGFGMGQPVIALLPLIPAVPNCKACERGHTQTHTVTHTQLGKISPGVSHRPAGESY